MFHATPSTRRAFLRRSALALAALAPFGSRLAQETRAEKNDGRGPRAIATKANKYIDQCFVNGGEPEVGAVTADAATVTCTSEDGSWQICTFTKSTNSRCFGSGDSVQLFNSNGDLMPITAAADSGEALPPRASTSKHRRKRRSRQGRKR